jgi:hypothetical protein
MVMVRYAHQDLVVLMIEFWNMGPFLGGANGSPVPVQGIPVL